MSLEQMYENADAREQAAVEKIHRACATFMQAHPEYLPSPQNERIMFDAMAENDCALKPTRAADWEEIYAQVRDQLEQKPRRQQRTAQQASGLTKEKIESWSAKEMEQQMYSPARAAEIQAVLSRG